MRFDMHLRSAVREQLDQVAQKMKSWEEQPRIDEDELERIRENVQCFKHTTEREQLIIGGADGSGDYPAFSYGDWFVYVTIAQGTVYRADPTSGLKEVAPLNDPLFHFTWIPEEEAARNEAFDSAFSYLAGCSLREVVDESDYRFLKTETTGRTHTVDELVENLVFPHAADGGNIGIQLRSTGELGAALRLMTREEKPDYVFIDSTMSLPFVSRRQMSLFQEHLKRLCCVDARRKDICFLALSKSHGLPSIELIESVAKEKQELGPSGVAEHWYLRLPSEYDEWTFSLASGRQLPPIGAVTYLVRFHKSTPVLRLDIDKDYWLAKVMGRDGDETRDNERKLFEDLDYACHDQRCYGYPYPIKAGHDRASMTKVERVALRKQIIDAAVKAGMKRSLIRDAAQETGHG